MMCIDIDLEPDKRDNARLVWYDVVRALYQYSWVKRKVIKTKNGLHVYLDIPVPNDLNKYLTIKYMFGDDVRRLDLDAMRWGFMNVNICFKNNEEYEVKL